MALAGNKKTVRQVRRTSYVSRSQVIAVDALGVGTLSRRSVSARGLQRRACPHMTVGGDA